MAETTNKKASTKTRATKKTAVSKGPAAETVNTEDITAGLKPEVKAESVQKNDEVTELKAQIAQLMATIETMKAAPAPQVVAVSADTPKVSFLWQAEVADDNVVDFGPYGSITGKTGKFFVPKAELSRVLDTMTRNFLAKRWLIVLGGLDEDEAEALGVNYKEGELLDEKAFEKIIGMGKDILEIFSDLCESHKKIVAKRYYEAWQSGKSEIDREVVIALYKMYPDEAFKAVKEGLDSEELN